MVNNEKVLDETFASLMNFFSQSIYSNEEESSEVGDEYFHEKLFREETEVFSKKPLNENSEDDFEKTKTAVETVVLAYIGE